MSFRKYLYHRLIAPLFADLIDARHKSVIKAYEGLVEKYNGHVDRFNANYHRINELNDIIRAQANGKVKSAQFTTDEINQLIRLCHPDKHHGSATANRITKKLLTMRERK